MPSAQTASAAANLPNGFDISHFDGAINWSQVAKAGMDFVIIKATDGTSSDRQFASNRNGANSIELPAAFYHFVRPRDTVSSQMSNIKKVCGPFRPGELKIVALDLEVPEDDTTAWNALVKKKRTPYVDALIDAFLEEYGVPPMLYMNQSFWRDVLGGIAGRLARCKLWLAAQNVRKPRVPAPWKTPGATIVQTTFKGKVSGVPANAVDLNVYQGTKAELLALTVDAVTV
jgi:GH25 family lysozyme M1 (1,4-beta-N-acetylmuramidase)